MAPRFQISYVRRTLMLICFGDEVENCQCASLFRDSSLLIPSTLTPVYEPFINPSTHQPYESQTSASSFGIHSGQAPSQRNSGRVLGKAGDDDSGIGLNTPLPSIRRFGVRGSLHRGDETWTLFRTGRQTLTSRSCEKERTAGWKSLEFSSLGPSLEIYVLADIS